MWAEMQNGEVNAQPFGEKKSGAGHQAVKDTPIKRLKLYGPAIGLAMRGEGQSGKARMPDFSDDIIDMLRPSSLILV
jgi:hypothetical protein